MRRFGSALMAGAIALAGSPATHAAEARPEPLTLKVVVLQYLSFAPFFIADEEGFFEREGLEIEYVPLLRSAAAVPSLVMGQIDVVSGHVSPGYLNAIARGAGVRMVADKGHESTDCAYRAVMLRSGLRDEVGFEGVASLRGMTVAAERTEPAYFHLDTLLRSGGLSYDDVRRVEVPNAAKIEAFRRGQIDLTTATEPWVTRLVRSGSAEIWISNTELNPGFQTAVVLFGPSLLEGDRDAGVRFLKAYLSGVRRFNEGKTERNLEILAASTGLDRDFLADACWPAIRDDGKINVESVLQYQAWAVEKGMVDRVLAPEEFWNPEFAERAAAALDAEAD